MVATFLKLLMSWMPVIFGVGFLAPVISAMLVAGGFDAFLGRAPIEWGLAIGLTWGLVAKFTGRWI